MSTESRRPDAAPTHAMLPASGDQLAGFFLPSPPFDHESRHWGLRHPWREPPADVVPADAGVMLVLARSEGVAVIVHQLEAWPGGFRLTLRVRTRPGGDVPVDDPVFTYEPYARRRVDHGKMPPPEQLLFGLQLPGGERLTNLSPGAPPGPFLTESRLPGVKGEWVYQYRLTPLPDPGLMWIVCEWPRLSIPISGIEVDAGIIRAVAERAIRLW